MQDLFSLNDKVIVVTGGTGILGNAFITAIAEAGGSVGILGRNEDIATQRADLIKSNGGKAIALKADVLDEKSLEKARDIILKEFGSIYGLVNGAGGNMPDGVLQPDEDIFDIRIQGMKNVLDLNLWGTIIPTQVFGKSIAQSGGGSIINISSMNSKRAVTKVLGYNMGKAAIDCYTQWFAVELARRYGEAIRINAIAPGFFLTEQNRMLLTNSDGTFTPRGASVIQQTPLARFGNADELKGALVWLLNEASKFVTDSTVTIDGSFSIFSGV